jgi:hypothetical protein
MDGEASAVMVIFGRRIAVTEGRSRRRKLAPASTGTTGAEMPASPGGQNPVER